MDAETFEHKPSGITLTMQPFTEAMAIAYLSAHKNYKTDDEHMKIHERDWMIKAALDCGWISVEPPLTSADVDSTPSAIINWIINGRKSKALAVIVTEALNVPKD